MKLRRISHDASHFRLVGWFKSPVVPTTILSALTIFFIFTCTIFNFSLKPATLNPKEESEVFQGQTIERKLKSVLPDHQEYF
ncbi:hypothetical protein SLA2020_260330 [Shorea laevis]